MVTVFTPAYNRANLLHILYNSLKKQTCFDFEWLIVDDGSTDSTKAVIEDFVRECDLFPIKYVYQNNHGKHVAINTGVQQAKGEMFFIVDSDDYLSENAIELIYNMFSEIIGQEKFVGIAGLRLHSDGKMIGKSFQGRYVDCTALEREKYNILGDKAEVYYTEILKKYPFPVFDDENFLAENIVWDRIANDGYRLRWFNEGFYYCEYLEGGLTKTSNKELVCFNGYKLLIKEMLTYKEISFKRKLISLMIIGEISLRKKEKLKHVAKEINVNAFVFFMTAYLGKFIRMIRRWNRKDK